MSISQGSTTALLAGGSINLDMIKAPTVTTHRRTKIVCTIGPACWEIPQLEQLFRAGCSTARLNFSHGDHKGHGAVLGRVRQAAKNVGKNVAILLDTKGPEIRTGLFAEGVSKLDIIKGSTIVLTTDYDYLATDTTKLAMSYKDMPTSVTVGQSILIADGSLVLTVVSIDTAANTVTCTSDNTCIGLGPRKNANLPGVIVNLPTFTEKDVSDIVDFGIAHSVDYIAASFVRKASDVTNLRTLLSKNKGQYIQIICKIENQEGLENYNEILAVTDGIMVARGDLGMEIPPAKVFLAQKYMIREANIAGKFVITATQMLESMITNPRPTRAECSDVANAVLDGSDAVMLSGETANGPYYEQAVKVMSKTCCEAEGMKNYSTLFDSIRRSTILRYNVMTPAESLASSAVKTAIDVQAKLIVVLSETGNTARLVCKYRPPCSIVCLTASDVIARQTAGMYSAVHTYVVDTLQDDENLELVMSTAQEAVEAGIAAVGDRMIVVSGQLRGTGNTNQVRVETIVGSSSVTTASGTSMRKLQSFVVAESE